MNEVQSRKFNKVLQIRREADACRCRATIVVGFASWFDPSRRESAEAFCGILAGGTGSQGGLLGKSLPNKSARDRHAFRPMQ
jgi:hypothetical protein